MKTPIKIAANSSFSQIMRKLGPFFLSRRYDLVPAGIYVCKRNLSEDCIDAFRILNLSWLFSVPRLIEFPEQTIVIAKDQPEYNPLPAYQFRDREGRIACCWKISFADRIWILFTGKIWHQILTFNMSLQPQLITIDKPEMKFEKRKSYFRRIIERQLRRWGFKVL